MQNYLNTTGRIFDIQKFSVHDGPGVRTIIFLKGCFLRCKWCCNPESQNYKIEEMVTAGKVKTVGRDVTVKDVLDEFLKDSVYYRLSGGGITLSGGECLFQPEFSIALLRATHEAGFNTAIESTANAPIETVRQVLPHVDHFLLDIKHMNSDKHKAFTGRDNMQILENARLIAKEAKHLIIRVPVIPTFNDTVEEISAIAKFTSEILPNGELHLLPYHRLGSDKYKALGRDYTLKDIVPPSEEHMNQLKLAAEKYNLKVKIGG